jgi:NAD(P)-dependent dehydrogenase (short-subunit alcohol dehydrogenase family)
MKLNLSRDLAEKVLSLTREYSYTPEEVISIGIALAHVLFKERALGNQVVIVAPDGDQVAEFTEVAPQAIDSIAEKYIESVCDGTTEESAAALVERLERLRDADGSFDNPPQS